MKSVLVVGAGGSLAHARSLRPKDDLQHPPLDAEFFAKATALASEKPAIRQNIHALRNAISASTEPFDPWVDGPVTFEQFLAHIYYLVASSAGPSLLPVFANTIDLYTRVLAHTTNWACVASRAGDLDRLVRSELALASDELTVVTCNHDLILESVAARVAPRPGEWCLRSLYGDVDLRPLDRNGDPRHRNHRRGCGHEPPFVLLKLQGSVNWFTRGPGATPSIKSLFPLERAARQVFVSDGSRVRPGRTTTATSASGAGAGHFWPLVVPSLHDRRRITGMRLLSQVWDRALDAIRGADRLVFVGYSVPDPNAPAKQMLRTALRQNDTVKSVDCVDPDASIAVKLREVLNPKAVTHFADLDHYLPDGVSSRSTACRPSPPR